MKRRRIQKRWVAGLLGAAVTALTVIEAAAPLCPALDAFELPRAAALCRAVTLTARAANGEGK